MSQRLEVDLRRIPAADIQGVFRFLSDRAVLRCSSGSEILGAGAPVGMMSVANGRHAGAGALVQLVSIFDHNNHAMLSADELFHLNDPNTSAAGSVLMLERGERVELGFRRKKDLVLFTNLRAILIDRDSQWADE